MHKAPYMSLKFWSKWQGHFYNYSLMITNILFCVFMPRSELWWPGPGTQWHHREPWLSSWISQLCQLHLDHYHWGAQPDTTVLSYLCSRGGLRHLISLRWTAPTRELESEVNCQLFRSQSSGMIGYSILKDDYNYIHTLLPENIIYYKETGDCVTWSTLISILQTYY